MNELLIGLLGAVIGGLFTAAGSWIQTWGTLRATRLAIQSNADSLRRETEESLLRQAVMESLSAVVTVLRFVDEVDMAHAYCKKKDCTRKDLPASVYDASKEVDRCLWFYGSNLLGKAWDDLAIVGDFLTEILLEDNDMSVYAADASDRQRSEWCAYGSGVSEKGNSVVWQAIQSLEEARSTIFGRKS